MKKVFAIGLSVLLLLSACSPAPSTPTSTVNHTEESTAQQTVAATTEALVIPPSLYTAPMTALSVPLLTSEYKSDDNTLLFTYTYQDFSLILEAPDVAESVTLDFLNRVDYENSAAPDIIENAKNSYLGQTDWIPYFYNIIFEPVRLDRGVLSLYGTETLFDGSPRSTAIDLSISYDLLTGTALEELTQILTADYSAEVLAQHIVEALDESASDGALFADYAYIISDMFATNTPIHTWYFSENGLCFYFNPYEIAPYSAGTIIAEVPYEKLNGILLDQYFPAEQAALSGKPCINTFTVAADYSQIAEIVIDNEAEQYLISTQGTLFDIRLQIVDSGDMSATTVFASAALCEGDALVIQCTDQTLDTLCLCYQSEGTDQTVYLTTLMSK